MSYINPIWLRFSTCAMSLILENKSGGKTNQILVTITMEVDTSYTRSHLLKSGVALVYIDWKTQT